MKKKGMKKDLLFSYTNKLDTPDVVDMVPHQGAVGGEKTMTSKVLRMCNRDE